MLANSSHFDKNAKAKYTLNANGKANLVDCNYFTTNILDVTSFYKKDYSALDSFVIFMCVEGQVTITANHNSETIKMGETVLLPAVTKNLTFNSIHGKLLEVYVSKVKPALVKKAS